MNKNIEDIQNDFEVSHLSIIPDGTLHNHTYIEIELIESGDGTQIINGQHFNIKDHYISILRPYIDNQSFIPHGTKYFDHSINFKNNTTYNIKYGAIHIEGGDNKNKVYLFLMVDNMIISENFLEDDFSFEKLSFFAKYSKKSIQISESKDLSLNFTNSKILSSNDKLSFFDISSNSGIGLDENFILDKNDLSFHNYKKSDNNTTGSFVFCCNINVESIIYRIITFKLNDKNKEINFLLSTEKVYISIISPQNEFNIYKLCIKPNIINNEIHKKLLTFDDPLCVELTDETFNYIKNIFELLIHFYKQNPILDKEILTLVDVLLKLFFDENISNVNTNVLRETVLIYFIKNNHFLNDIKLNDFAEYLGYEPGYASRLCIKYTGYSFVKYKVHLRLQYAKHLISSTNIPIQEISIKSGFNSLSVFNRFFKKETGLSPSLYRTSYQKNNI